MSTFAKLALAAAVVGVAVVGIYLLRASGEVGQSSPPSSQALVPSPMASASSPAVALPPSTASPAPTLGAPTGNGLIAYSSDGDIFVGDPVTGTFSAIVTGPRNDTRPIFSPDGLRIAFLRAESERDAAIVVVRADGSDERVVMADGFTEGFPGFAWTPDSTSILLAHAGELSLVDASGVAAPRRRCQLSSVTRTSASMIPWHRCSGRRTATRSWARSMASSPWWTSAARTSTGSCRHP